MELITLIISLLGFPAGILLGKIAFEELELGEKYFLLLRELILLFSVVYILDKIGLGINLFLLLVVLMFILIKNIDIPAVFGYLILILLFKQDVLVISIMIFLYGLVSAGLWMRYLPLHKFSIMAHRGASYYEKENTMKAFEKAVKMNSDYLEVDVRITADRKLVAMHDPHLKIFGKKGKVKKLKLKELPKEVAKIEDVVKLKNKFNFDVKDIAAVEPLVKLIKKKKIDCVISSFCPRVLRKVKLLSDIKTGYLFRFPFFYMIIVKLIKADGIHPAYQALNKEMVRKARQENLEINVYYIKTQKQALKAAYYYGVDGLIIDDPELLKTSMKKYDFHIHTKKSRCANLDGETILRQAKIKGLNGIAITDHNTIKGALEISKLNKDKNFEVIVGEEIETDKGEILALGIKKEIKPGKFEKVIKEIKKQNAKIVIAHPYTLGLFRGPSKLKSFKEIDGIECLNGRCFFKFENLKAQIKAKELDIPCFAGSDAHFYFEIGKCYTTFTGDWKKAQKEVYGTTRNAFFSRILTLFQKYIFSPLNL